MQREKERVMKTEQKTVSREGIWKEMSIGPDILFIYTRSLSDVIQEPRSLLHGLLFCFES